MSGDNATGPSEDVNMGEEPEHLADLRELTRQAMAARLDVDQTLYALREFATLYSAGEAEPLTPAVNLTAGILADLDQRREAFLEGRKFLGYATGFATLDDLLGGLETQRLTVLLAHPGAGKTTFSNQLAHIVAAQGAPVLYVTFENTREALILRQVARLAGKKITNVERGHLDPGTLTPAFRAFNETAKTLYYVAGTKATTVAVIHGHVEQLRALHPTAGYPLVIVDYLQRLARTGPIGKSDDARLRVGNVSQELTDLARATGAHVWAISSIARDSYKKDARANLSSAKESGDIEFDADAVISLNKPEDGALLAPHGTDAFVLSVEKHRHGKSGNTLNVLRDWDTLEFSEQKTKAPGPGASWANKAKGGA